MILIGPRHLVISRPSDPIGTFPRPLNRLAPSGREEANLGCAGRLALPWPGGSLVGELRTGVPVVGSASSIPGGIGGRAVLGAAGPSAGKPGVPGSRAGPSAAPRRGSTSTTAACRPTRRHVESGRLPSPPHPCYLHPGARRSRHQSAWIPLRRWGRKQCRLRRGIYILHASCSHVLDVAIGHRIQCLHEAAVNVFDKMSTRYLFLFFLLFPLRIPSLLLYKRRRRHCDSTLRWLALSPRQYKSYCQPRPRAALWSCCSHLASEGFSSWNYLVILFPCS